MGSDKEEAVSISITGLACRFPGDGESVSQFWDFLCQGSSAWSEIPKDRFDPKAFAAHIPTGGHFLKHDVSLFDSGFFRVSHAEACAMDPQQRLMMEVVYEALEAAGYPLDTIAGTKTGVFMGHFTSDYRDIICKDAEASLPFSMTGLQATSLSNRISWIFDLKGPSMTIDTACSSSLTALHLACQSIRVGESEMAVVGGCNLMLNPDMFMFQTGQNFLSPDGKCKTFDISADGYGRGEGFAVLVLRRTQDAIRHRDPVRAIIRGTGANQDGHTNGFTLPSSREQEALIRQVYSSAGLDLNDTDYVEAHGTGTQAGDLGETTALGNTFGAARAKGAHIIIGSVKPSIGHLEAAAGLAGVIKSVLMLEQATIPPNTLFRTENPKLRLQERNLKVPTSVTPWPADKPFRRISVNSFGYGGSNVHAVLENSQRLVLEWRMLNGCTNGIHESTAATTNQSDLMPKRLFAISAQDKQGITRAKDNLELFLKKNAVPGRSTEKQSRYMASLAFTLSERRTHLQWKTYVIASSLDELGEELSSKDGTRPVQLASQKPRLGFVFTGQGAQWAGMGLELMQFPVFRDSVDAAGKYLQRNLHCAWSVTEELSRGKSTSKLAKALYSQTLCTVLQVALVDLLKEWQIMPSAVVGHSSGEIAAAYCSGALAREDAWRVAYSRGVVCSKLRDEYEITGAMMAVGASPKLVEEEITKADMVGKVHVACVNSPQSVTVSGEPDGINALFEALQAQALFARKLKVDTAYHSPHMLAVAREYLEAIGSITAMPPNKNCTMYSSVSGRAIESEELGPAYWARNMVSSVQFSAAIQQLMRPPLPKGSSAEMRGEEQAVDVLVELGPHSSLQGPAKQCLNFMGLSNIPYHSVLLRNQDAVDTTLNLVGTLFTEGYVADLGKMSRTEQVSEPLVDLPTYPWNHSQSHWAESRMAREYRLRKGSCNDLIGQLTPSLVAGEHIWRSHLRLTDKPWIAGHKIQGNMLYPAAGFIAMAVEAALFISPSPQNAAAFRLRDIHLTSALIIESEDSHVECTVSLKPHLNMAKNNSFVWMEFIVSSCQGGSGELVKNCHGLIMLDYVSTSSFPNVSNRHAASLARFEEATRACNNSIQTRLFYRHLDSIGLSYGPDFQNLTDISIAPFLSVGVVQVPAIDLRAAERPPVLHPATLDAVFHLVFAALQHEVKQAMVPKSIDEIVISNEIPRVAGARITGFSDVERRGFRDISANVVMLDEINRSPVLRIVGLCCTNIGGGSAACDNQISENIKSVCSKLVWRPSMDHLQPEEQTIALQQTLDSRQDCTMAVNELLMLLHHCNPELHISEIVLDTTDFCPTYFNKNLSDVFKTAKYTLLYSDDEIKQTLCELSEVWDARQTHSQSVDVCGLLKPLACEGGSKQSNDLVIIVRQTTGDYELRGIMQNAFKHLAETGRLCLTVSMDAAENVKALGQEIGLNRWTSIERKGCGDVRDLAVLIGSKDVSLGGASNGIAPHNVVILQGDDPSPACRKLTDALKASLELKGYSSTTESWNMGKPSLEGRWCISLLEVDEAVLPECTEEEFTRVKAIILQAEKLLWMTNIHSPGSALTVGVARTFRNEEPGRHFDTLQVDLRDTFSLERIANLSVRVFIDSGTEGEFAIFNDMVHVSKVVEDDEMNGNLHRLDPQNSVMEKNMVLGEAGPLKLGIRNAGLLDTLCYEPDPIADNELGRDEVEISVKVASLNFRDVMTVMGQVPGLDVGFDAAGVVRRVGSAVTRFKEQDRVVMCNPGAHRTRHRAKADYCAAIPESMSFEEAASIPLVHGTAWYALVRVAQAKAGQSLLIHAAAGGVGQAALQMAKYIGMEIFATVGSDVKRRLLRDEYGIPDDHIYNSRDVAFADQIKTMTCGRGVDVVLNSLTGEALRRTWYCIAPFGTFVEIGLKDILGNSALDMKPFVKGVTFASFDLKSIALKRPDIMGDIIKGVFEMQMQDITRPISPLVTYPASQAETAFRLMQTGQLLGKALLSFSDDDVVPVLERQNDLVHLDPKAAYLLVGGLGGLGRSIAKMLVHNGARKMIFFSRSGASTPLAQQLVVELQNSGAHVHVHNCDVSNPVSVLEAVEGSEAKFGPIRGVIQCAMVLSDTLFRNMSHQEWVNSIRPKVQGTWNLHETFPNVDFFISLGSFTAIFGNRGQSNYVAGCAYQDAIAHLRRKKGLRAVTIDLGVVRDIGVLAEQGMSNTLADFEVPYGLFEYEVLNLVKMAINSPSMSPQILTGLATAGRAAAAGVELAWYLASDPKFAIMAKTGAKSTTMGTRDSGDKASTQSRLHLARSLAEATDTVVDALVARVAKMLRTSTSEIDTSRFLHSYGVDSLVAIEIVNWVLVECKAQISTVDILASIPLASTAKKIASLSTLVSKDLASNYK